MLHTRANAERVQKAAKRRERPTAAKMGEGVPIKRRGSKGTVRQIKPLRC